MRDVVFWYLPPTVRKATEMAQLQTVGGDVATKLNEQLSGMPHLIFVGDRILQGGSHH